MTRATDSHDAGMQAHDQGLPRDTYTSDFWITRSAWLAGWDSAADLKANPPADWNDVAFTLPLREATPLVSARTAIIRLCVPSLRLVSDWLAIADDFGCKCFFVGRHVVVYAPDQKSRFCMATVGYCENGDIIGDIIRND